MLWRRACNNWNKKTELPWPLLPWHVLEECHHGLPVLSLLPRLQRLAAVVGEDGVGAILVPVLLLLLPNHVGLLVNRGREGSGERAGFPAEGGDTRSILQVMVKRIICTLVWDSFGAYASEP